MSDLSEKMRNSEDKDVLENATVSQSGKRVENNLDDNSAIGNCEGGGESKPMSDNVELSSDVALNTLSVIVQQDDISDDDVAEIEVDVCSDNEGERKSLTSSGRLSEVLSYEMGCDDNKQNGEETVDIDNVQGIDVICGNCGKHFQSLKALGMHLSTQHGFSDKNSTTNIEVIQDDVDKKDLNPDSNMLGKVVKDRHQCGSCEKNFTSARILHRHSRVCQNEPVIQLQPLVDHLVDHLVGDGDKNLSCKLCEKSFRRPSLLRAHIQTKHGSRAKTDDDFTDYGSDDSAENSDDSDSAKGSLKVAIGHRYYRGAANGANSGSKTCPHCGKILSNPSNKRKHIRKMHADLYSEEDISESGTVVVITDQKPGGKKESKRQVDCTVCHKTLSSQHALMEHMRTHTGERPFQCQACDRAFTTPRNLKKHMLTLHSSERPFKCDECGKSFALKSSLKAHAQFHSGIFRYRCASCGKGFQTPAALRRHEITHTNERPYACDQCSKRFNDTSALKKHLFYHTGLKPHVCDQCGAAFATTSALRYHGLVHTGVSAFMCHECGKSFRTNSSLQRHQRIHSGDKPYHCDLCTQNFAERWQLVSHHREHTGEKPYQCTQCGKRFVSSRKLTRHMHIHNPSHLCNDCGKSFTSSSFLKIHSYKHTGEHPHQCEQCPKKFSTPALLRRHLFSHTGIKPFVCDWCGKCFTTMVALRNHTSLHTGIRPHVCDTCGKGFPNKTALKIHAQFHSDDKPYQCDLCGRKFHRVYELNHHRVIHNETRPFQCSHCDKAYHHKSALDAHLNTHTEEKWYHCEECDKSFLREATLRKHKKTHALIKPHLCTECGKRFVRKEHLRRHLQTHTMKLDESATQEMVDFHDNLNASGIMNLEDATIVAEHVEMSSTV